MYELGSDRPITVVLADDHEVVRAGLRRLLMIDRNIKILYEAANGYDSLELIRYHKPDIALLDILMPGLDGIEVAKTIKKELPEILTVFLTAYEDSLHLNAALKAGADGYITKDTSAKELIKALHDVMNGERVFSKSIINMLQNKPYSANSIDPTSISISQREQEVLNLVAFGMTSPDIADKLNISVRTVQSHRSNIMQKLGIKNAGELIRYAVLHHDQVPVED